MELVSASGARFPRGVRRPGLLALPPGVERYVVPGRSARAIRIAGGDVIRLVNAEGGQVCELVCVSDDGRFAENMLGQRAGGSAAGLRQLVADGAANIDRDLAGASSLDLFGPESRAGEEVSFSASGAGTVIVATPGAPMAPDGQDPATPVVVFVERAPGAAPAGEAVLPEPLADPRLDQRIDRRTAASYEVRAGEWVQIIDVDGRQCTDFQAFHRARLDEGVERCLDVTTTRSLMGLGYPHPGQRAKYLDQDFTALIEVVQDTCMRHDAFGLACAAKYYEDQGYPGHANCSDNFNTALEPYTIQPRRGWMAMNFFYNTEVDGQNLFVLDEPWSRPGDYVLLRALTDLVCVSSACPDDIDAANGWNPTDIHVRVYPETETFTRAVGHYKQPDADVTMTKETGFHARTSGCTRDFVEYNGYWLPSSYTGVGPISEYWACRERVAAIDLSPLRKFEVLGPGAEALLQHCLTRNVRKLAVGQVVYTAMCYDTGTMLDDGTLFRLGRDNFRWIGGCDQGGAWLREQAEALGLDVWVRSSTDQLHNLSVQGPLSRQVVSEILWTPPAQPSIEELGWFRFSVGRLGEPDGPALVVSRTGYTGELGYEVFCHPSDCEAVWDAVWAAGEPHGLSPLGLEALDILRIEAGLVFSGYEFDDQTDPFEAGIGFTVPLKSKEDDFCGKAALVKRKANPQRILVGLELTGDEVAGHGDGVFVGRHRVGVVTSGTRSPITGKSIALCRMAVEHAALGTAVEVGQLDGVQKRLEAAVVPFPSYDPEKSRVRM